MWSNLLILLGGRNVVCTGSWSACPKMVIYARTEWMKFGSHDLVAPCSGNCLELLRHNPTQSTIANGTISANKGGTMRKRAPLNAFRSLLQSRDSRLIWLYAFALGALPAAVAIVITGKFSLLPILFALIIWLGCLVMWSIAERLI